MLEHTECYSHPGSRPGIRSLGTAAGYLAGRLHVLAVCIAVILAFQYVEEAYQGEFGKQADEGAHYVTGLMVRDYVTSGWTGDPLQFANRFYEHYPKVALGHWPPGFYLAQAAWTLPFGVSRESLVVFMALLTALLAWTTFLVTEGLLNARWGWLGAILLLCVPQVHEYAGMLMMEIPMSLLTLWGALAYARYLSTGGWKASLVFGLIAAASILTKYAGLALAFVPLAGLVLCGRRVWLKRVSFWIPAMVVVLICGPWVIATLSLASDGMAQQRPSAAFALEAAAYFPGKILTETGAVLLGFGLVGVIAGWITKEDERPLLASLIGLIAGTYLLYLLVPTGLDVRHMTPVLAPVVIFAVLGAKALVDVLVRKGVSTTTASVLAGAMCVSGFALETFELRPKGYRGFQAVAQSLKAEAPGAGTVILVSSDASGESMLVSEVAMIEQRPDTIVRRASKLLAESDWRGNSYEAKAGNVEETVTLLMKEHVEFLVIDRTIPSWLRVKHHELLEAAVAPAPNNWKLIGRFSISRNGDIAPEGLEVYRLK